MYILNLQFENNSVLTYNSLPYQVADIWMENFIVPSTEITYEDGVNINEDLTHFSFPHYSNIVKHKSDLVENIRIITDAGYTLPYDTKAEFNREVLNSLHEYFHTHVESKVDSETDENVIKHILELNHNIHKLEPFMNDLNTYTNMYSVVAMKSTERFSSELPEYIKNLFTIENFNHGIKLTRSKNLGYINYTTIGKHLYNCFHDNDIDIVKKNLIRNKTKGDNFIKFSYGQSRENLEATTSTIGKEYIENWLDGHKIENKEDILTQDNLNQVYPPILEMTDECEKKYTTLEIFNLYKNSKLVKINTEKI